MADTKSTLFGSYTLTTNVWDPAQLTSIDVNSQDFKLLLVRLYQNLSNMAQVVNSKESGFYDTNTFVTGQQYFPNPNPTAVPASQLTSKTRQVFRKTFNMGALKNAGTTSQAHGITLTPALTITHLYGAATQPLSGGVANYIPLPFVDPASLANGIKLSMDQTNINITTAANYSAYTISYVVVEWMIN